MKCSYYGCESDVDQYDPEVRGFQFCIKHQQEANEIMQSPNAARLILSFWIKAQGGASRAADRAMGKITKNNP